jgi:hypothetical protein
MQEQELFQKYELKGWQLSPYLYKIIGASALINLVAFLLMAQANFLTGKTCDSPIASGVCSVVDALYVGLVLSNTDERYIDENYIKTELEDSEEITYVNVGDYKPLEYPAGYFALANPEQQVELIDSTFPPTDMNGFPTNPTIQGSTGDLTTTKPITPTPNTNPFTGTLPVNPYGNNKTTTSRIKKDRPKKNDPMNDASPNKLPGDTTAETKTDETKTDESEKVEEIKINKKVMMDFGNNVKAKLDKREVDINKPFKVVIEGVLTKEGKLDTSIDKKTKKPKSGFTLSEGDPQMVEVAREALEAVGDSGWLGYLRNLGAEKVKITFEQDQDKIIAIVESEQKTPEKAASIASGLKLLISTTRQIGKLGEDETILLNGAQPPTSNGNFFILNFELPKEKVREIIDRNMKKAAEANQNSTAQTENTEQKTSK